MTGQITGSVTIPKHGPGHGSGEITGTVTAEDCPSEVFPYKVKFVATGGLLIRGGLR